MTPIKFDLYSLERETKMTSRPSKQRDNDDMFSHEEVYLDYEIYVDDNPDPYSPGLVWAVCRDGEELDDGLEFDFDIALETARNAVRNLNENKHVIPEK